MKQLIKILLVLFLFSQCFTGLSCSAGQNRNEGSNNKIDDQSDELSKILYKAKEMPFLKSLIVLKNDKYSLKNLGHPYTFECGIALFTASAALAFLFTSRMSVYISFSRPRSQIECMTATFHWCPNRP